MSHHVRRRLLQLVQQVLHDVGAVVGVDEAERVQPAALSVRRAGPAVLREVGGHEAQSLPLVAAVDHPETRRR